MTPSSSASQIIFNGLGLNLTYIQILHLVCLFDLRFNHFLKWQRNESLISANYHAQETTHGYHHHHDSIISSISNNLKWIRFELNLKIYCQNRFVCLIRSLSTFQNGKVMRNLASQKILNGLGLN